MMKPIQHEEGPVNYRNGKIRIGITGLLVALSILLTILAGCKDNSTRTPNVILVITDDQGYGDIAAHGNSIIRTPNLDEFYNESVRFTNFHVGTTCAPTRAGLMTGRNCNRNGVWHTIGGCSLLNPREETMADVFAASGYVTGMFGKWHLGDTYPFRPFDRGFQVSYYHGGGGVGQTPDYWQNDYFDDTYFRNGSPERIEGYCTDIWFREALRFIRQNRNQPFFCYLSTNAPHGPYNLPGKYLDLYRDADLLPHQKRFYGMISNIDDNFGILLDRLEEWGIADNTILIFMTDNGTSAGIATDRITGRTFGYNAGMRGIKGSPYEGGHRVPLMIRWSAGGLTGGRNVKNLAAHVDLLPTLAELCSIPFNPRNELDGTSLAGLLLGETDLPDRMLVTDTQRQQWPEKGRNSCVMQASWRLVNGTEFYDLETDPGQETDVSDLYPDRVRQMNVFYEKWWTGIEHEFEYSYIRIGSSEQNPVLLTCHDMHTDDPVPWNQNYIREGRMAPVGFYSIEVVNPGEYEILMHRWPLESGLGIGDEVVGLDGTDSTEAIPPGVGKKFSTSWVEIQEDRPIFTGSPDPLSGSMFRIQLSQGRYNMKFYFRNESGAEIPAYYISLRKL